MSVSARSAQARDCYKPEIGILPNKGRNDEKKSISDYAAFVLVDHGYGSNASHSQ